MSAETITSSLNARGTSHTDSIADSDHKLTIPFAGLCREILKKVGLSPAFLSTPLPQMMTYSYNHDGQRSFGFDDHSL